MGVLDWISKYSFSRPFHKNQTRADFKEWFAKAPGWDTLDPKIAEALIERLYGNPIFEVFVHLSREARLIGQYEALNGLPGKGADEAFVGAINNILFRTGSASLELVVELMRPSANQDELKKHYGFATDCFECAIELQPSFLHAYVQQAVLKHLFNRDDEARDLCNRGLVQAGILKKAPLPSHHGMNLRSAVDEAEARLRTLLAELQEEAFGERVIGFENQDPTTEIMARAVFEALKKNLADYTRQPDARYPVTTPVRIVKVRLWETASSWAEYSED